MIFSASRRTDIPTWYAEWLCNRLASGEVCVRHDARRVTRWLFSREAVDCLVLWTKNPLPLPDKRLLAEAFGELAGVFGADRMVWRYDPVLLNEAYTVSRHVSLFEALARRLRGHTRTCVISFMDMYPKLRRRLAGLGLREGGMDERRALAARVAEIAARNGMALRLCAEDVDVPGAEHGGCISREIAERAAGCRLEVRPSRQRTLCRCVASVDVGVYGTCGNGCLYCYANAGGVPVGRGSPLHDPASPLLTGRLAPDDAVSDRRCASLKSRQFSLL